MKKTIVLAGALVLTLAVSSCGSSQQSAYKKAYEKAKQEQVKEATEVDNTVYEMERKVVKQKEDIKDVRQEKLEVVSGRDDSLNNFSVVAGSFGVKANALSLKDFLQDEGYSPVLALNAEKGMYRVIVSTFSSRQEAEQAKRNFKNRYPNRKDFQGAWLLYRIR